MLQKKKKKGVTQNPWFNSNSYILVTLKIFTFSGERFNLKANKNFPVETKSVVTRKTDIRVLKPLFFLTPLKFAFQKKKNRIPQKGFLIQSVLSPRWPFALLWRL